RCQDTFARSPPVAAKDHRDLPGSPDTAEGGRDWPEATGGPGSAPAGGLRQDASDTAGRAPQSEEASHAMTANSFGSRATLRAGETDHVIYRLDAVKGADSLPFSLKVLLENLLRNEDGRQVTADHVTALAEWDPTAEPATEIQFTPARVILQDLTGVPA